MVKRATKLQRSRKFLVESRKKLDHWKMSGSQESKRTLADLWANFTEVDEDCERYMALLRKKICPAVRGQDRDKLRRALIEYQAWI